MVQLTVLNGKQAGTVVVARRFPFRIGRGVGDLQLEEDGVWEAHGEVRLGMDGAVVIAAQGDAKLVVDGQSVLKAPLKNGDVVELGAAKVRFGLTPTRQYGLRFREVLTWLGLIGVVLTELALIYWMVS